uniref:Uncharacterized conserved protein, DUF302 family n=1 Tax=Candidatus Kentrum sp. LFY TaxID=2126342 RepID=A0A450WDM6_9GAMM|nr:MAG: Uncharacterized conserved protein, DUF302 family [Candidatus Kentron sp. LFY]VFJ95275.1 MAG: Uncharacterized conserved protein, DUF302 family [Candidatus Kentron sp. LFY]VFK15137.1 MAG: Uncharacterized conserved protein, DUF302 family [Candidatus Kentron sp. LFY]
MYGFNTTLSGSFSDVVERVIEALKKEGFGILSDIDVQATLKAKLDLDYPAYRILGACNPSFANRVLATDIDLGLLLPCNVVVRQETDGIVTVAFMDPVVVMGIANQKEVTDTAKQVRIRLEQAKKALESSESQ